MVGMTCTHCSKEICDACWRKRADVSTELEELRGSLVLEQHTAGRWLTLLQRIIRAPNLGAHSQALADARRALGEYAPGRCTCGDTFVAVTGAHDAACPVVRIRDKTGEQK